MAQPSPHDVLDDKNLAFGICLEDELLFTLLFFEEDLTIPADRDDLGDLAGKQLITAPQKLLLLDRSRRIAACTGRKTIKTINLESKMIQWSLWNRRLRGHDEAMVVTPGQTHLGVLMDRVFPRVNNTPLFSLFCGPNDQLRGDGLQRWATNIYVYWVLEGLSGTDKNMAGIRAKWVLGDEMAFGNCLAADTFVPTENGIETISAIKVGTKVFGWHNDCLTTVTVLGKKSSGVRETYEVRTATRSIVATTNHPFLVAVRTREGHPGNPSTCASEWELQWKPLAKLKKGDLITIARDLPSDEIAHVSENMAELIGMFIGDGSFTCQTSHGKHTGRHSGISLAVPPGNKARIRCIELMTTVAGRKPSEYNDSVVLYSAKLANWLPAIGISGTAKTKRLPPWCFNLPPTQRNALLKGILATDGHDNVTGKSWYLEMANELLIKDIRTLAWASGWRVSNIHHRKRENYWWKKQGKGPRWVESWIVTLKQLDGSPRERNYKWSVPRGVNRISLPKHLALDRIRSIDFRGEKGTWDIETESANFVANGILVHNSICHGSRIQSAFPRARWIYSGVPNFLASPFRRITDVKPIAVAETEKRGRGRPVKSATWSLHGGSTYKYNPLYLSEEARADLIESYDGIQDPLYQTQVLGLWTDQMGASAFPPGCFALHQLSYAIHEPQPEEIANHNWARVLHGLQAEYAHYVMGFDWGYSPDPAVLMILGSNDLKSWFAAARFRFREVPLPNQVDLIQAIAEKALQKRVRYISSDSPPALQLINSNIPWLRTTWSMPQGGTERIDSDGVPLLDDEGKPIKVRNREFMSELIRDSMSYAQLKAPYYFYLYLFERDYDLLDELAGTSATRTTAGYMVYHAPGKTPGAKTEDDHNTDALRDACDAAYKVWLEGIDPVEKVSVEGLGMVGESGLPGQRTDMSDLNPLLYPADMYRR